MLENPQLCRTSFAGYISKICLKTCNTISMENVHIGTMIAYGM